MRLWSPGLVVWLWGGRLGLDLVGVGVAVRTLPPSVLTLGRLLGLRGLVGLPTPSLPRPGFGTARVLRSVSSPQSCEMHSGSPERVEGVVALLQKKTLIQKIAVVFRSRRRRRPAYAHCGPGFVLSQRGGRKSRASVRSADGPRRTGLSGRCFARRCLSDVASGGASA